MSASLHETWTLFMKGRNLVLIDVETPHFSIKNFGDFPEMRYRTVRGGEDKNSLFWVKRFMFGKFS